MKTIGNIIWFIIAGIWTAIGWAVAGLIWCITIIGIPFGTQCFKIAGFALWPFKKDIRTDFDKHPIANIIWIVFCGWELCLSYLVLGLIFCITVIGIPFGKQCFKLMRLALIPFGSNIK